MHHNTSNSRVHLEVSLSKLKHVIHVIIKFGCAVYYYSELRVENILFFISLEFTLV